MVKVEYECVFCGTECYGAILLTCDGDPVCLECYNEEEDIEYLEPEFRTSIEDNIRNGTHDSPDPGIITRNNV